MPEKREDQIERRDPPYDESRPLVPIVQDLAALPPWARVAFTVRCARRVWPLLEHDHGKWLGKRWIEPMQKSLEFAELASARADVLEPLAQIHRMSVEEVQEDWQTYVRHAHSDVQGAEWAAGDGGAPPEVYYPTRAVVRAAETVGLSVLGTTRHTPARTSEYAAAEAAEAALSVAKIAPSTGTPLFTESEAQDIERKISEATWLDYELLRLAVMPERRNELGGAYGVAFPPGFFGPLWRHGVPAKWTDVTNTEHSTSEDRASLALKLEIAFPAALSDSASSAFNAKIASLLAAMSAFDVVMGGTGLKILDECSNEPLLTEGVLPVDKDELVSSREAR